MPRGGGGSRGPRRPSSQGEGAQGPGRPRPAQHSPAAPSQSQFGPDPRAPGAHRQSSGGPRGPGGPQHGGPRRPGTGRPSPRRSGPGRGGLGRGGPERGGPSRPRRNFDAEEPEIDETLSGPIEADYLKTLVEARASIEVHLRNGETHSGTIEYYDQRFIRLTPQGASNKFIFKHDIKYMLEK